MLLEWADHWPVKNPTTGGEGLRKLYQDRNVDQLKRAFPMEWGALQSHLSVLQPFFEEQGYEDLLWW